MGKSGINNHDRFLIIDDVVYIFGASLKDAGKKLFAYIKMQETSADELLSTLCRCETMGGFFLTLIGFCLVL